MPHFTQTPEAEMEQTGSLFGDPAGDILLSDLTANLLAQGLSPGEIEERLAEALPAALPEMGACLLKGLHASAAEMLADRRARRDRFLRRLRMKWGHAFDLLRMLLEASREAGETFNQERGPQAAAEQDYVFEALIRLHARACLVTTEVLWQMEGGFASGAMARWRTLHEIVVVAIFIKEHGHDVAERYLLHYSIESHKAAVQYQSHCAKLGKPPFEENEILELQQSREGLRQRFGTEYETDWGWAAAATGLARPTFADIERAASLEHMRPYFKLASYGNHAGCKGIRFDLGHAHTASADQILLPAPAARRGLTCLEFSDAERR